MILHFIRKFFGLILSRVSSKCLRKNEFSRYDG
jgi:hypothetical protein